MTNRRKRVNRAGFAGILQDAGIRISLDGRARWMDDPIRLWRGARLTRHTEQQSWRDWRPDDNPNRAYPSRQTVQTDGATSDTADGERQDDEGGPNTGTLDKALHPLKSLDARLKRLEVGDNKTTSKSVSSAPAVLSVPQFLDIVGGASATDISMPPDFSKAATPRESVETRVIRALDEGVITGADAATAESMLAMWNVAQRGGDVTVDQFMDRLASKGVPQSVRDLWNVRSIPARLSMH